MVRDVQPNETARTHGRRWVQLLRVWNAKETATMTRIHLNAGESIMDAIQRAKERWHVRVITATPAGTRAQCYECVVNAPDQFSAIAVAIYKDLDDVEAGKLDDVHVLVDRMPPKLVTEEDIIERSNRRKN